MKLKQEEYTTTTSFDGEEGKGGFNSKKLGFLLDLLVRNYNYPELAILREWVSNGHDSHVLSGQDKPVKVTIPTALNRMLIVEDFGLGLSHDDFVNVYMVVGLSTKDEDDLGIGGFGIGSKSALSISDQYTVRAVKDGLENFYIIKRDSEGGLSYQRPIADRPTDLPNGVKTQVNVDRFDTYTQDNLNKVLGGWKTTEVEITNGSFESIIEKSIQVPSGYIMESTFEPRDHSSRNGRVRIMVGPVLYEVSLPDSFSNKFRAEGSRRVHRGGYYFYDYNGNYSGPEAYLIPTIEIGKITFPASREVIETSRSNLAVLEDAYNKLYEDFKMIAEDRVSNLSSEEEALKFSTSEAVKILQNASNGDYELKYRGEEIPSKRRYPKGFRISKNQNYNKSSSFSVENLVNQYNSCTYVDLVRFDGSINKIALIHNDVGEDLSDGQLRSLIRHYHKMKGFEVNSIYVTDSVSIYVTDSVSAWDKAIAEEEFTISGLRKFRKDNPATRTSKATSSEDRKKNLLKNIEVSKFSRVSYGDKTYSHRGIVRGISMESVLDDGYDHIFYVDCLSYSPASKMSPILNLILDAEGHENHESVTFIAITSRHKKETLQKLVEFSNFSEYLESKVDVVRKHIESMNSDSKRDLNLRGTPKDKVIEIYNYFKPHSDGFSENMEKVYAFLKETSVDSKVEIIMEENYESNKVLDNFVKAAVKFDTEDKKTESDKKYFGLLNYIHKYNIPLDDCDTIVEYMNSQAELLVSEVLEKIEN